jgi:hypothetical protein
MGHARGEESSLVQSKAWLHVPSGSTDFQVRKLSTVLVFSFSAATYT